MNPCCMKLPRTEGFDGEHCTLITTRSSDPWSAGMGAGRSAASHIVGPETHLLIKRSRLPSGGATYRPPGSWALTIDVLPVTESKLPTALCCEHKVLVYLR